MKQGPLEKYERYFYDSLFVALLGQNMIYLTFTGCGDRIDEVVRDDLDAETQLFPKKSIDASQNFFKHKFTLLGQFDPAWTISKTNPRPNCGLQLSYEPEVLFSFLFSPSFHG